MGLLAWLGLKQGGSYPNLDALLEELRKALPQDEAVVLRYIAIVIVLIGKVACVDGRFTAREDAVLRSLLAHVNGLAPTGIEAVCKVLQGNLPALKEAEVELCYRELKALCDAQQRAEIVRLLIRLAAADGAPSAAERQELEHIAAELGVAFDEIDASLADEGAERKPS